MLGNLNMPAVLRPIFWYQVLVLAFEGVALAFGGFKGVAIILCAVIGITLLVALLRNSRYAYHLLSIVSTFSLYGVVMFVVIYIANTNGKILTSVSFIVSVVLAFAANYAIYRLLGKESVKSQFTGAGQGPQA